MIDINKHRTHMLNILLEFYGNVDAAPWLGFKGGTACYFLYGLDRFSVDLDFNLINEEKKEVIINTIKKILEGRGVIKDFYEKENTIFFLYSYGDIERNIKVEINKRDFGDEYEFVTYLGVNLQVLKKEFMFAHKLVALTDRRETVARDLYDINFFFNKEWDFNSSVIEQRTGKSVKEYFASLLDFIPNNFPENKLLDGLGELISEEQKKDIKKNLIESVLKHLRIYLEVNK